MNARNSNRVNMINATITFCDSDPTATAGIPLFATVLGVVKSKMVLVNSFNQVAEGSTEGVTLDTRVLRRTMTVLAVKCGSGTLAYANAQGNNALAAQVRYTESGLDGLKKEEVDDVCMGIHDATAANAVEVVNYGVSPIDVSDLLAAIELYRIASQHPRQAVVTRSQAKRRVTELIDVVVGDLLVKQLDKMANTLRYSNADFWNGYRQSREVLDLGSTTAKVRGTIKDDNGDGLMNAEFRVMEAGNEAIVKQVFADEDGKFSMSGIAAGDYDFMFGLDTYEKLYEYGVHIAAGKEYKRNVVLVKL